MPSASTSPASRRASRQRPASGVSSASVAQKPGSNSPLVVAEQFQLAFAGADDDRRLLDDGARDGDNARGLRQSRGKGVKTRRPRRERAISRLARTKRDLGLLAFGQLDIRPLFQALGIDASLLDRLVPPHALQRLRGTRAQHVDVLVIVGREFARRVEVDLKEPDHVPVGGDRKHETRPRGPSTGRRSTTSSYSAGRLAADLMTTGARRRSDSLNGESSPHSIDLPRLAMVELVSHGARDGEVPAIVGQQKEHAGAGAQPVQRLVNGGRNRVCRGSGVTERRVRLCQTVGLRGCALGGHAARIARA